MDKQKLCEKLSGIPASPGLAVGRVCFWNDPEAIPRYRINPAKAGDESKRLDAALELSRQQISGLKQRVEKELGREEAAIFSAHNLLLNDSSFYSRIEKKLMNQNLNLEAVVEDVIEEMVQIFLKIPDRYLRERADDYRDVGRRLLENLMSHQRQCAMDEGEQIIIAARELMPSDTVHFPRRQVGAFITEQGGISSHAAILARSLRIPAVAGVPHILTKLQGGERVLVDGNQGIIIIDPQLELIEQAREDTRSRSTISLQVRAAQAARTREGVEIYLSANLTREVEAEEAKRLGALGVGLLRTEFLFMDRGEFLDEDEQYKAYRHVVETVSPYPVTIRTLDIGEDKHFDFENPVETESDLVMGWRSIRLSLANQKIFFPQLKAILRAAAHGPVRILLPMIIGIEEIRMVKQLMKEAARELKDQGITHELNIPVGAMIETPAAAISPRVILQEADFISVGTNDLVQYIMVADRNAERMQPYYRSAAPAILMILKQLAATAQTLDKDISICGEIAGDPLYLPLLLGLGYRKLSVAPVLLPDMAGIIGNLDISECETLAQKALQALTADEVEHLLQAHKQNIEKKYQKLEH